MHHSAIDVASAVVTGPGSEGSPPARPHRHKGGPASLVASAPATIPHVGRAGPSASRAVMVVAQPAPTSGGGGPAVPTVQQRIGTLHSIPVQTYA